MITKLDFLQKYASVEYAPLLQEALLVWETCSLLIPLRERTLELIKRVTRTKERLEFRELFTDAQCKVLISNDCWEEPVNLTDENDEPDREGIDAWLGIVLRLLTAKCSDAIALADGVPTELRSQYVAAATLAIPMMLQRERNPNHRSRERSLCVTCLRMR